MAPTNFMIGLVAMGMGACLLGPARLHAQGTPAPTFPAAKVTPENPLGLTIDHLAMSVMDLDKVAAFYENVFGFKTVQSGNWTPDVKYRTLAIAGVFRIDMVQHAGSERRSPAGRFDMEQGLLHLCFKTSDLNAAYQRVIAKRANVRLTKGKDGAITEMYLIDPEGNEVEVQRY